MLGAGAGWARSILFEDAANPWVQQIAVTGYFEGQALESVACPRCNALALRVLALRDQTKGFRNQVRIRDVNESPMLEAQTFSPREISA